MVVSIDFELFEEKDAKVSVFDRGLWYGEGVFETIRADCGKPFMLGEHVVRLLESARIIGIDCGLEAEKIEMEVLKVLGANKVELAKINILLTSGVGGFAAPCEKPTLIITAVPMHLFDSKIYTEGVKAKLVEIERVFPEAKTVNYLPSLLAYKETKKAGAFEGLFVKDGKVLEGSTSNLFVVQGGKVITPRENVLIGVTRDVVIEIAKKFAEVQERDVTVAELFEADEAFITATLKKVVPVVEVDGRDIGDGKVGEITKEIIGEFEKLLGK